MNELPVVVADEQLVLHVQRAIWWAKRNVLLLADVHVGKGHVLRNAGVTVPTGQTVADLQRIDALIDRFSPGEVIVLGDLVHGHADASAPWIAAVSAWRARHAAVAMTLVSGNHDRHFDAEQLGFKIASPPLKLGPFALCHEPCVTDGSYTLAGHVHPGITLHDGWRRHRVPAFRFQQELGLLPAFGSLTGMHEQRRRPLERIIAVTPGGLIDVP